MTAVLMLLTLAQSPDGKGVFEKRCTGCHALDNNRAGPQLGKIYGGKAGAVKGFPYSDALKNSRIVWNADALDRWLADPEQLAPGNDMAFRVVKPEERAAIINYLRSLNGAKR